MAGYWPLRDPLAAAKRVFFSDGLTRCGAAPAMILAALDLDPRRLDGLERFDPAQPRVPAGNGVESGRWTSDGGATGGNEVAVGDEPRSDEDSLFSENLPARVVQGLIRLAARSSVPSIVFDTLFVPSAGKSGVTEGDVPGRTGLQYSWDKPAGQVLSRVFIDGHWVTLTGGRDNLNQFYRDADGNVIARAAGDALVVDLGSLDRARERLAEGSGGQPPSDPSSREPKLCPDKSREDITGRSEAALAYQEYVSGLPREFIIEFNGVEYDGCDQLTGLLKEGKGNYAHLLTKDGTWQDWASDSRDDIQNQIMRQSKAAALSGRRVAWYVQQNPVANIFREWVNDLGITNIDVYYDPGP
ncbi:MAG: Tox-REase-5 domain-containing protein [Roseiarcus sp.]